MIWTKEAHNSAKFQTFDCSHDVSPNLYLDRILLLKVHKISPKKVQRSYVSKTLKGEEKFEHKIDLLFQKCQNLVNCDLSTRNSQNFYIDWFLLWKVYNVWPKEYRGVIYHDTEEWCKIWRKTNLWFGKWHERFGKFSPETLKVSKLRLSWDPFV